MPVADWIQFATLLALVVCARGSSAEQQPASQESPEPQAVQRHWSFQPIGRPEAPPVAREEWVRTEVDRFILAELEKRGLVPNEPADRATLLRRAKFDLLGLPPTWEEIEAFKTDASPDAYFKVIERYLASPHYGERWGRHWLDVARYADTKGYAYAREERRFVHAHIYRDWVVRALNDDVPYDQFLVRQIAADQLGEPDGTSLAAMGFLTLGRRFINVIHDIIDDRIDVVFRGTMGLTVSCARCHDHKYDPIPTTDYYSLYGVFAGSTERALALERPAGGVADAAFEQELLVRQKKLQDLFEAKREELLDRLRGMAPQYLSAVLHVEQLPTDEFYMSMLEADEINPVFVRQWHSYLERRETNDPQFAPWRAFAALPAGEFQARAAEVFGRLTMMGAVVNPIVAREFSDSPPASMAEVALRYGRLLSEVHTAWQKALESAKEAGTGPPAGLIDQDQEALRQVLFGPESPIHLPVSKPAEAEFFFAEQAREELGHAQARIDQWIVEAVGAAPHAVILEDRPVQQNSHVLIRGNPKNKGAEVARQFLEVVAGPERQAFRTGSGRLELAQAIANRDNPLTARVMANRIWMHHFGKGLVNTPSDFGVRSDPPSHPELLDFLARRFIDAGWSVKDMHRLIMFSSTYQQASTDNVEARRVDPDNGLLWRMNRRRLDFESTRDALLAVSGQLDATIGGQSVDLTTRPFTRRRTVYGYIDRLNLPSMYRVFDFASPDTHSPQRYATMVPQQALFLMNHPLVLELSRRLLEDPEMAAVDAPEARIELLYRRIFARSATADEIALARQLTEGPADEPVTASSPWRYGVAACDDQTGRTKDFSALPLFTNEAWHAGPQLPDLKCGWPSLNAAGGHPPRERGMAVVRRWTAPAAGTIDVDGNISHMTDQGDGIRARVIHSRAGELASWTLHKLSATSTLKGLKVEAGETIDFVVDGRNDSSNDAFQWAPVLRMETPGQDGGPKVSQTWDAKRDFGGPVDPPLSPWARYAQVLLLANEFVTVD